MNHTLLITMAVVLANTSVFVPLGMASPQEQQKPDVTKEVPKDVGGENRDKENDLSRQLIEKEQRIKLLEARMERLEKIVFATSKLSVYEAVRQLAESKLRLKNSERLFFRGFLADIDLQQDRFVVDRAQRELELAQSSINGRVLATEIDVMQAEQALRRAQASLEQSENYARRGFATQTTIENGKTQVEVAKRQLDIAKKRLEAISKDIKKKK